MVSGTMVTVYVVRGLSLIFLSLLSGLIRRDRERWRETQIRGSEEFRVDVKKGERMKCYYFIRLSTLCKDVHTDARVYCVSLLPENYFTLFPLTTKTMPINLKNKISGGFSFCRM